jgi:RNA polymerase sigma-70 factor, ECF subfamily
VQVFRGSNEKGKGEMKSTREAIGEIQRLRDAAPSPGALRRDCSDEVLARRARAGERPALIDLALRHWNGVYRIVRNMLVSDASEAAEATFRTALASAQAFPDGVPFRILLYRAAVGISFARLRSSPQARSEAAGSLAGRIRDVLGRLEAIDRACYVLRDLEELSWEEAAFVLRTSPRIVRERAHRVRMALTVSLDARLA